MRMMHMRMKMGMKKRNKRNQFFVLRFLSSAVLALAVVLVVGMGSIQTGAETYVTLENAGQIPVTPGGDTEITGNYSVKLPGKSYRCFIARIVDFEYDADADSYRAKWKEFPEQNSNTSSDDDFSDKKWVADFFRENYEGRYAGEGGPQKLAQESAARQTEVYTALQEWTYGVYHRMTVLITEWANTNLGSYGTAQVEAAIRLMVGRNQTTVLWDWQQPSDANAVITLTDKPLGQYLLRLSTTDETSGGAPLTVTLLPEKNSSGAWTMSDKHASFKFAAGQIEKSVDRDQVAAGDTVHFTVDASVPDYEAFNKNGNQFSLPVEKQIFRLEDVMSSAFALQQDSLTLAGRTPEGDYEALPADCYTLQTVSDSKGGTRLQIALANTKIKEKGYTGIRLEYDALVTEAAAVGTDGNTNTAKLTYTKNIEGDTDSVEDTVTVWTYGVRIIKVDGDTLGEDGTAGEDARYLPGATFVLYKRVGVYPDTEDDAYVQAVEKYAAEGLLYTLPVYDTDGKTVLNYELYLEYGDTLTSTADAGGVSLGGLGTGVYLLEETLAPEGYNLLKEGLRFEIQEKSLEEGESFGHRPSQSAFMGDDGNTHSGYYDLLVRNYKGLMLPDTGGGGTSAFTVAGLLLMTAALLGALKINAAGKLSA